MCSKISIRDSAHISKKTTKHVDHLYYTQIHHLHFEWNNTIGLGHPEGNRKSHLGVSMIANKYTGKASHRSGTLQTREKKIKTFARRKNHFFYFIHEINQLIVEFLYRKEI